MTTSRPGTPRVVVVGDVLLDVDLDGRTERISPDAPVPVVDLTGTVRSPGGAGLTALLCAGPDVEVTLVAPLADDDGGQVLRERLEERMTLVPLGHRGGTRTKTRVRSGGQTLLRLDSGGTGAPVGELPEDVERVLAGADVVLVSDYGAGTTSWAPLRDAVQRAATRGHVVWDPHPRGGRPVPGCSLVTPNLPEARSGATTLGLDVDADRPEALGAALRTAWDAGAVCVTAGSSGAYLCADGEPLYVPAIEVSGDPCGAGDRFASSAAVGLARGAVLSQAVVEAVQAASAWVADGGAAAFRRLEPGLPLADPLPADPSSDSSAPATVPSASELARTVRARGGTVVATGGCFDVLHAGHVASLQAARGLGTALVVLLNSDESVRRAKGPGRPVVPAHDRARVLLGLGCVDAVEVFDEDEPSAALERLRPDVWAKGGDYGGAVLPEAATVRRHGGRVVLLPYLDGRSSSRILAAGTGSQP